MEVSIPFSHVILRIWARNEASSEMCSAKISMAPKSASSVLSTPFSGDTKAFASSSFVPFACPNNISFASGSKPFSFAIVALVRRFGRYGR